MIFYFSAGTGNLARVNEKMNDATGEVLKKNLIRGWNILQDLEQMDIAP